MTTISAIEIIEIRSLTKKYSNQERNNFCIFVTDYEISLSRWMTFHRIVVLCIACSCSTNRLLQPVSVYSVTAEYGKASTGCGCDIFCDVFRVLRKLLPSQLVDTLTHNQKSKYNRRNRSTLSCQIFSFRWVTSYDEYGKCQGNLTVQSISHFTPICVEAANI